MGKGNAWSIVINRGSGGARRNHRVALERWGCQSLPAIATLAGAHVWSGNLPDKTHQFRPEPGIDDALFVQVECLSRHAIHSEFFARLECSDRDQFEEQPNVIFFAVMAMQPSVK
ncbi:hypothetical protein CR152_16460 [Massilia violaceinigra]|uniref:Uncharacterized protein n=1 Tax=Massilia violaceinigra TaxID=2045208 RepID=A0A2D2DLT8_9BURK|nr:hypothetical protein CR152_16460 [Massilia violaceinigra]